MTIEPWEEALIARLRGEAHEVTDCFTRFSFQALAFAAGVLVFVFKDLTSINALACVPAIAVLMTVSRLGAHKYSTANRNHGFELHLSRTRRLDTSQPPWIDSRWRPEMRFVEWEEALRAWRVVQPTLFRSLYLTPQDDPWGRRFQRYSILNVINRFRPDLYVLHKDVDRKVSTFKTTHADNLYPWFLPKVITDEARAAGANRSAGAVYYAGSYLNTMQGILFLMQWILLVPLLLATVLTYRESGWLSASAYGAISSIVAVLMYLRWWRVARRRELLESEILSIHSCAIVWHAVVLAHHLALEECGQTFKGYTESLALLAADLSREPFGLHRWLYQARHAEAANKPLHPTSSAGG